MAARTSIPSVGSASTRVLTPMRSRDSASTAISARPPAKLSRRAAGMRNVKPQRPSPPTTSCTSARGSPQVTAPMNKLSAYSSIGTGTLRSHRSTAQPRISSEEAASMAPITARVIFDNGWFASRSRSTRSMPAVARFGASLIRPASASSTSSRSSQVLAAPAMARVEASSGRRRCAHSMSRAGGTEVRNCCGSAWRSSTGCNTPAWNSALRNSAAQHLIQRSADGRARRLDLRCPPQEQGVAIVDVARLHHSERSTPSITSSTWASVSSGYMGRLSISPAARSV